MNTRIQKQLLRRKRRIERRLDKTDNRGCEKPMFTASNIHYEIAERTRAVGAGGIGAIHLLARKIGLIDAIDRLSKKLRERIGESLGDLAATPPLANVTTGDLDGRLTV